LKLSKIVLFLLLFFSWVKWNIFAKYIVWLLINFGPNHSFKMLYLFLI
jgi:hypothetical protein